MAHFKGFTPGAITFLRQLEKNNKREWFQPRKEQYEEIVKAPMQNLLLDLAEHFRTVAPEVRITPKSIFRIYRDTRFSKDKKPYKTHIAAYFPLAGAMKGVSSPGLYLHVAPKEVFVGAGLYMPESAQLRKIRYAFDQNPDGYLDIIGDRKFKSFFGGVEGESLKRPPQGYTVDHPMIDHLRRKQFLVSKTFDVKRCQSARFKNEVAEVFTRALPLVRWLRDNSR